MGAIGELGPVCGQDSCVLASQPTWGEDPGGESGVGRSLGGVKARGSRVPEDCDFCFPFGLALVYMLFLFVLLCFVLFLCLANAHLSVCMSIVADRLHVCDLTELGEISGRNRVRMRQLLLLCAVCVFCVCAVLVVRHAMCTRSVSVFTFLFLTCWISRVWYEYEILHFICM